MNREKIIILCGLFGVISLYPFDFAGARRDLGLYRDRMKSLDNELALAEKTVAAQRDLLRGYTAQKSGAQQQISDVEQQIGRFVALVKTIGPGIEKIAEAEKKIKALDVQIAQAKAQFNAGRAKPLADLAAAQKNVASIRGRIDSNKARIEQLKREIDTAPDLGKKIEYGIVKGAAITDLGVKIAGDEIAYGTAMGLLRAAEAVVSKIPATIDPRISAQESERLALLGLLKIGRGLITEVGSQGAQILVATAQPIFVTVESLKRVVGAVDQLLDRAAASLDQLAREIVTARGIIPNILIQNEQAEQKIAELQRFVADMQGL